MQVKAHSSSPPGPVTARLGAAATATVLIVDDDHAGAFGFENETEKVAESKGFYEVEVRKNFGINMIISWSLTGNAFVLSTRLPVYSDILYEHG